MNENEDFPEPPDAPDALVDVGKECPSCGRNRGIFPIVKVCSYCRPVEQPNGDVITGIAFSPAGSNEYERLPNTSINVQESHADIVKGPHANCEWLQDGPQVSADGAHTFFIGGPTSPLPPATWWIRFRNG